MTKKYIPEESDSNITLTLSLNRNSLKKFRRKLRKSLVFLGFIGIFGGMLFIGTEIYDGYVQRQSELNTKLNAENYATNVAKCRSISPLDVNVFKSVNYGSDARLCSGSRFIGGFGYHFTFWNTTGDIVTTPENVQAVQGNTSFEKMRKIIKLSSGSKDSFPYRSSTENDRYKNLVCHEKGIFYEIHCSNALKREKEFKKLKASIDSK